MVRVRIPSRRVQKKVLKFMLPRLHEANIAQDFDTRQRMILPTDPLAITRKECDDRASLVASQIELEPTRRVGEAEALLKLSPPKIHEPKMLIGDGSEPGVSD